MLKNAKLGTQLYSGFGIVLVLLLIIGSVGWYALRTVNHDLQLIVKEYNVKTAMANELIDSLNLIARAVRNVILLDNPEEMQQEKLRIEEARKNFQNAFGTLKRMVTSDRGKELLAGIQAQEDAAKPITNRVLTLALSNQNKEAVDVLMKELRIPQRKLIENIANLIHYQESLTDQTAAQANRDYQAVLWTLIGIGIAALVSGMLIAFGLTTRVTRALHRVIDGLNESAEQVVSASGQIASGSQALAEGSTEQAASLEETSSAIEQISGMTKQNAQHADQANSLMKETVSVMEEADTAMKELTRSMQEITQASEETSKIVKSIDEIAFQTNLLALNAAVEAARAGEAGAGFAVVADEVRNLAMRAAEAAKNTAGLIDTTVRKIMEGSGMVLKTNSAFDKMAGSSANVAQLVAEIAAASREQAMGIEQMNRAIAEMEKVVQQNAANAEENAAASEEMNGQATQMETFVKDLVAIVGVNGSSGNGNRIGYGAIGTASNQLAALRGKFGREGSTRRNMGNIGKRSTKGLVKEPGLLIPLDEEEAALQAF
ncbi:methyl-accepting chemotaxis protein [Desulfatirhabdium butyrativorans]|uniref:methyl-accepting chemotaxis protein n=1 Tax=Desulfatirhabdium butyrativorans TaxID=340467 RepID=UPI000412C54B